MTGRCKQIRKEILEISKISGHGHLPSCFSIVEILCAVYDAIKHDPKNPNWEERDIFVLSKGHAALAHYCVLAEFGYFGKKHIETYGSVNSDFGCHADRFKVPGAEVSTGSLGHGIGVAAGMALAFKIQKSKRRVFTLVGDGEANEGSVWEAAMVAANLKLDNFTIIYDNNMSQSRGLQIKRPDLSFKGFGCEVVEANGHNIEELKHELAKPAGTVKAVIANTKKGYGCNTLIKCHHEWHRKSPNDQEFVKLMEELDEEAI